MATGKEISFFSNPAARPQHLALFTSGVGSALVVGGSGRNRIGVKGNRFRMIVGGSEERVVDENYIDGVIVGASPGVSRIFYGAGYDPTVKAKPTCYSVDGVKPAADVHMPQSVVCQNCPQNEVGSRVSDDGRKTRACGFFKRLAFVPLMDPDHRIFQIDLKSMSVFGESGLEGQNKFTLGQYAKKLQLHGYDPAHMVTRLSFDTDASVPKLFFSPNRTIAEEEVSWVTEAIGNDDIKTITTISAQTTEGDDVATQATHGGAETAQAELVAAKSPVASTLRPKTKTVVTAPAKSPIPVADIAVKQTQAKPTLPPPQPIAVIAASPVQEVEDESGLKDFLSQLVSGA
jgi:hypothetical protein